MGDWVCAQLAKARQRCGVADGRELEICIKRSR